MGSVLSIALRDERGGTGALELIIVFTLVVFVAGVGARMIGESERASFLGAGDDVAAVDGARDVAASESRAASEAISTDDIALAYVGVALLAFVFANLAIAGLRRLVRRRRARERDERDEPASVSIRFGALDPGRDAVALGEGNGGVE